MTSRTKGPRISPMLCVKILRIMGLSRDSNDLMMTSMFVSCSASLPLVEKDSFDCFIPTQKKKYQGLVEVFESYQLKRGSVTNYFHFKTPFKSVRSP